jgi:molecular chaperone DnaK (HSP70)
VRHTVGIDLGTSNTVVAHDDGGELRVFAVPQLVSAREMEALPLLPSVLYAPLEGETEATPFDDAPFVVGEWARRRRSEIAGRHVDSSKSWLAHAAVDRTAPILPWGAEEGSPRLSPVDAAARVLAHVRRAWDEAHPGAPLAEQHVVLTVPASFDDDARTLTVDAATRAGLSVRLLEEPQAAFYDRLADAAALLALADRAGGTATVLVVDVGGGTTDLSLLAVSRDGGAPRATRVAVGRHLLLGGDNMDLALAHLAEGRLIRSGDRLDAARFAQLVAACRAAKETLLSAGAPESAPVAVLAAGSRLVGGTLRTELSRAEVEELVLEGFLPVVRPDDPPPRPRAGLLAFGLPYETDVAITRHVRAFLARHADAAHGGPHAVLLNGGVFRAERLALRVVEALRVLVGHDVTRIPDADPDLAVARGAVRAGLAMLGHGRRIGSGAARAYYLGVGSEQALCVLPRGAEEGAKHRTEHPGLELVLGRAVRFDLYASDARGDGPGDVLTLSDAFDRLPPVAAAFSVDARHGRQSTTRVAIEAELSPTGTLDLACVDPEGRRFRLAFVLRAEPRASTKPPPPSVHHARIGQALALVDKVFGKTASPSPREVKDLVRDLEKTLGERPSWTLPVARELFDAVARVPGARRRSAEHERVFFSLAGFCVRPGFGDPGDAARTGLLARLFAERLGFPDEVRGWQQLFICYRRAAAGLDGGTQLALRDAIDPFVSGKAGKKMKRMPEGAWWEAVELAAALERVPAARREELGEWLLDRALAATDGRLWAALGRIGARVPTYGGAHEVVSPATCERWVVQLLRAKWDGASPAARAASQLARVSGDRARDLPPRIRADVARRLRAEGAGPALVQPVEELVDATESDRVAFFGEDLPPGLRLAAP